MLRHTFDSSYGIGRDQGIMQGLRYKRPTSVNAVTVTVNAEMCAPDPARLGKNFCATTTKPIALTEYADLKLVTATPTSGSCVTGKCFRPTIRWVLTIGVRLRAELCFYPTVTGPVAIGYLNDYSGLKPDNNELLVEVGIDLYFGVPLAPGSAEQSASWGGR